MGFFSRKGKKLDVSELTINRDIDGLLNYLSSNDANKYMFESIIMTLARFNETDSLIRYIMEWEHWGIERAASRIDATEAFIDYNRDINYLDFYCFLLLSNKSPYRYTMPINPSQFISNQREIPSNLSKLATLFRELLKDQENKKIIGEVFVGIINNGNDEEKKLAAAMLKKISWSPCTNDEREVFQRLDSIIR